MTLKHAMNGAKLPNWVTFIIMGLMLGIHGASLWFAQGSKIDSQGAKIDQVVASTTAEAEATKELTAEVKATNDYLEDTVAQANRQHRQMWEAIGKPQRMVEIPTRREWQNHQWEWQK